MVQGPCAHLGLHETLCWQGFPPLIAGYLKKIIPGKVWGILYRGSWMPSLPFTCYSYWFSCYFDQRGNLMKALSSPGPDSCWVDFVGHCPWWPYWTWWAGQNLAGAFSSHDYSRSIGSSGLILLFCHKQELKIYLRIFVSTLRDFISEWLWLL
jgi:hypothetical protein